MQLTSKAAAAYWAIWLATDENTLFALPPIRRTVPITITSITASITAYSAMSCPSSLRHKSVTKSVISDSFEPYVDTPSMDERWKPVSVWALVSQIRDGSGKHFFAFLPLWRQSRGNGSIFDGGVRAEQDDRLRIAECSVPVGVENEGLRQSAGRGHKYRLYLPAIKNVSPAGPELDCGLKLAQQAVAIEVSPAVHEDAIFGIKSPDRVASPVVINENSLGLGSGLQERDSSLGILLRLVVILAAGETDPLHQRKQSNQNDNGDVKIMREP